MTVVRLPVSEVLAAMPVGMGEHLDTAKVAEYASSLDRMPPIVVFRTPDGLILADGYHRLEAARRAGADTIEAEVRTGSKAAALRYAVELGARQRGLSAQDVRRHVLRRFGEETDRSSSPGGPPPADRTSPDSS